MVTPQVAYEVNTVDHDTVTEESLNNAAEFHVIECMPKTYGNSSAFHGMEEDNSSIESDMPSRRKCLTTGDVVPVETARSRFLDIILNNFIADHVVEVVESASNCTEHDDRKQSKKKPMAVQYEGDCKFVLPLMYVANMYETLVNDVDARLVTLTGMSEKSIGVALEANGGLYRRLSKKFPRKGPCTFRRRELATSLETRKRFPELVVHEEKRVRFVVVNGLEIVEKPTIVPIHDAEWFKCLTGREEVAVSPLDYKFYSPRPKYRHVALAPESNFTNVTALSNIDNSSTFTTSQEFCSVNEVQVQPPSPKNLMQRDPSHAIHHASHLTVRHSQRNAGVPVGGRLQHAMPTLAKFCDECGVPFVRQTSKFCIECGAKRFGT